MLHLQSPEEPLCVGCLQSLTDLDDVDLDLIASLLHFLCSHESDLSQLEGLGSADEGAILVFLPGWDEIMRLRELLESQPPFNLPGRYTKPSVTL